MSKNLPSVFSLHNLSRWDDFTIGFDRLFENFENLFENQSRTTFPAYNILKRGEDTHEIVLSVAGYTENDLTVQTQNGKLVIRGNIETVVDEDVKVIHRGIAARKFERVFSLADGVEVEDVVLRNGLLTITLRHVSPPEAQATTHMIKTDKPG